MTKNKINEKPILFNGEMVRAILSGKKTQTRRMLKPHQIPELTDGLCLEYQDMKYSSVAQKGGRYGFCVFGETEDLCVQELVNYRVCPHGNKGDELWVRETFADTTGMGFDRNIYYAADCLSGSDGDVQRKLYGVKYKPSIHMPRKHSRINLEIINVKVERLQDISEADAKAEGIEKLPSGRGYYSAVHGKGAVHLGVYHSSAKDSFCELWDSIYNNWDDNPWVWVYEFKIIGEKV